ncbi:MAG TPA: T9SS type A sorting domain-containing protein [Bacteroidia bacterium]|nr:T9SS type A sorting domain-containing protein [Bacteroidia bacterium]
MNRISLLLLLLIELTSFNVNAQTCGPAIIVTNNKIQQKFNFTALTDNIHIKLDPSDSTLIFWLYVNGKNCDFSDANWSKNGVPIATGLACNTSGNGIYRVTSNLNNHPFDVLITVNDSPTGITEPEGDPAKQLNVFSNPSFYGLYTLKREIASEPYSISIFNKSGELVKEMKMENKEMVLEISDFPKGTYLLEWASKNGDKGKKKFIYD